MAKQERAGRGEVRLADELGEHAWAEAFREGRGGLQARRGGEAWPLEGRVRVCGVGGRVVGRGALAGLF